MCSRHACGYARPVHVQCLDHPGTCLPFPQVRQQIVVSSAGLVTAVRIPCGMVQSRIQCTVHPKKVREWCTPICARVASEEVCVVGILIVGYKPHIHE
jgi:hypothetical protein